MCAFLFLIGMCWTKQHSITFNWTHNVSHLHPLSSSALWLSLTHDQIHITHQKGTHCPWQDCRPDRYGACKKYHLHCSTINRINCRYAKSEDYYNLKQKTGRPSKFTIVDTCQVVRMLANTNAHDITDLQKKYFLDIHPDTIQERLTAFGLKAYICCKKPLLTKAHKQNRLVWAKAHANWTVDNWKSVIFSNESKFMLIGSDGHSWCWGSLAKL